MPSKTVPYHPGLTYGVGLDTPSGEARNIAATGTPTSIFNAGGDIISFSMMQIDTVEDLHTALGISASAQSAKMVLFHYPNSLATSNTSGELWLQRSSRDSGVLRRSRRA